MVLLVITSNLISHIITMTYYYKKGIDTGQLNHINDIIEIKNTLGKENSRNLSQNQPQNHKNTKTAPTN